MERWREMLNVNKRPPTRVSKNGQVVLPAQARRAVGIEAGDLVVSVPVAPGVLLVEKVGARPGASLRELYDREDNPLEGLWGPDPDAWLDELRGRWDERQR
jgi:AbrB family looped-hinge helix DNA binding protein